MSGPDLAAPIERRFCTDSSVQYEDAGTCVPIRSYQLQTVVAVRGSQHCCAVTAVTHLSCVALRNMAAHKLEATAAPALRRTIPSHHPSACPGHLVGTSVPSRLNKGRCLLKFVAHTPCNASSRPAPHAVGGQLGS